MRAFAASLALTISLLLTSGAGAQATDLATLLPSLKAGGHVIVLRHTATDQSQEDVVPLDFADMSKQRQLSEDGRETARQLGAALLALGVPIGDLYTSRLNRAVETAQLIAGRPGIATDELTDSSAGRTGAMDDPGGGGDDELGAALRTLASIAPAAGTNTLVVTHKTNIIDAFGDDWTEVKEGEASIFKPDASGALQLVARVQLDDWLREAGASNP